MNRHRIATLLRELADAVEAEDEPQMTAHDLPRRRRVPISQPRGPIHPPSDIARARARQAARRLGHLVR